MPKCSQCQSEMIGFQLGDDPETSYFCPTCHVEPLKTIFDAMEDTGACEICEAPATISTRVAGAPDERIKLCNQCCMEYNEDCDCGCKGDAAICRHVQLLERKPEGAA